MNEALVSLGISSASVALLGLVYLELKLLP